MRSAPPKPIPPAAWVLAGATGVAVCTLAAFRLIANGHSAFFETGDARLYLLTTRDLFGTGHGFAALGFPDEIPYRYGRVGLPMLAWLLAFGRPALVGWTMIGINLAAITAIPGLAAIFLDDNGAAPEIAGFVIVLPAFVVLYGSVFADPLLIALLLTAYVLDGRSHHRSALGVLAYAMLVKEIAALALLPLLWRAGRRAGWRDAAEIASALLPYAAWCAWLRWRVGEFPFLANSHARSGALGLPFAGLHHAFVHPAPNQAVLLTFVGVTIALAGAGAWLARGTLIGGLAAASGFLTLCLGPEALRLLGEGLRVLLIPQVFGILALVVGVHTSAAAMRESRRSSSGLFSIGIGTGKPAS